MDKKLKPSPFLRPTSPFRTSKTIERAWKQFVNTEGAHSLRAVELCGQHPGKMWTIQGSTMSPLFPFSLDGVPWHSNQYANLPEIYVQNASLELCWKSTVEKYGSISGESVIPFLTRELEGIDINSDADFRLAEDLIGQSPESVSRIAFPPFKEL